MRALAKSILITLVALAGASSYAQQVDQVSKFDAFIIHGLISNRIIKIVSTHPIQDADGRTYTLPIKNAVLLNEQLQARFMVDTTYSRANGNAMTIRTITKTYIDPETDRIVAYDVDGWFKTAHEVQTHNPDRNTIREFMNASELVRKLRTPVDAQIQFSQDALAAIVSKKGFHEKTTDILKALKSQVSSGNLEVGAYHDIETAFTVGMTNQQVAELLEKTGELYSFGPRIDAAKAAISQSADRVVPEIETREIEGVNR